MTITRRMALAAAGLLAAPSVRAEAPWTPTRPVNFVYGFATGGTIDIVVRIVAKEMEAMLGQPVLADSRPGGSGNIAMQYVLRQPADGHTIGLAPITLGTNPHLMNVGYDPIADVQMVARMTSVPVAITMAASTGFNSLADMVAFAKGAPEKLTLGHGGVGTSGFLAAQLFARAAGFTPLMVPYTGTAPVFQAMLAGTVHGTFTPVDGALAELVGAGKLRVMAVMQDTRIALLPEAPTTREQGYGPEVDFRSWHGVLVRPGTPAPIMQRWFDTVVAVVAKPHVQEQLLKIGVEPAPSASIEDAQKYYLGELARWGELIRAIGIRAQ